MIWCIISWWYCKVTNVQECCHVRSQCRHRTPKPWKVCKRELTSFQVNMTWCIFLGAILTNKPILKEFKNCWQRSFQKWCGSGSLMSNLTQATGHELKSRPWANFNLRHGSIALDLVKHLWLIPNFQWWLSSNLDFERRNGPSHQQLQIYHPKDKRHGVVVKAACMQRKAILKYTDTKSYFKSLTYWYSPEYSGPNKNPALVDLRISQSCCVGILSLWWMGFLVNFHCKTRST